MTVAPATEPAKEVVKEVVAKPATRRENGEDFYAFDFAYTPDPANPTTWQFRLSDAPGLMTKGSLDNVAKLIKGSTLEAEERNIVARRVRDAYSKIGVPDIEVPETLTKMYSEEVAIVSNYVPSNVTSYTEMDEVQAARKLTAEIQTKTRQFPQLVDNILYSPDIPATGKGDAIVKAANELAAIVKSTAAETESEVKSTTALEDIKSAAGKVAKAISYAGIPNAQQAFKIIKSKKNVNGRLMVFKDNRGNLAWLARYSNNIIDTESDVISAASHKNYVKMVDAGLLPHPDLWLFHEEGTRIGKANWLAYDDEGFAMAGGTFDKGMERIAKSLAKIDGLGVSHGMPDWSVARDPNDPRIITQHVTEEISVLPMIAAANQRTAFVVLEKSLNKEHKMLPSKKKTQLKTVFGLTDDDVASIEKNNKSISKSANILGVLRKQADPEAEADPEEDAVADEVEAPGADAEVEDADTAEDAAEDADAEADTEEDADGEADEANADAPVAKGKKLKKSVPAFTAEQTSELITAMRAMQSDTIKQVKAIVKPVADSVKKIQKSRDNAELSAPSLYESLFAGAQVTRKGDSVTESDEEDVIVDGREKLAKKKPASLEKGKPQYVASPIMNDVVGGLIDGTWLQSGEESDDEE